MPDVYVSVPKTKVQEGSSFSVTAYFRDGDSANAPTTAKYRIDCLTTQKTLTDWTSLSAAVSNTIAITATENAIQNTGNAKERKQITVASDPDSATQTRDVGIWDVVNNYAF